MAFVSRRLPQAVLDFVWYNQYVSASAPARQPARCGRYRGGYTLVVTNEDHRFLSLEQLCALSHAYATLLLEPAGSNTAPALTLAALQATEDG